MRAAAFPLSDDVVVFGNQGRRSPKMEVRKRSTKTLHKDLDVLAAVPWLVQRILQQHVGGSKRVDNSRIVGLAPKFGEPSSYNRLILGFRFSARLGMASQKSQSRGSEQSSSD